MSSAVATASATTSAAEGAVVWITGLPGAGKTTLAQALAARLQNAGQPVLLLDGDTVRNAFDGHFGFDPASRRLLAGAYGRLAGSFAAQGLVVLVATVSMFDEVRAWNRANLPRYWEVYLTAPEDARRSRRAFYSDGTPQELRVSENAAYELPKTPDQTLHIDGRHSPEVLADEVRLALAAKGWIGRPDGRSSDHIGGEQQ